MGPPLSYPVPAAYMPNARTVYLSFRERAGYCVSLP